MFQELINNSDYFIPDCIRNKIYIQSGQIDDTLFMTTTALLYNRVENLNISFILDKDMKVYIIDNDPNTFSFYWFTNFSGNPDCLLKPVESKFSSIEKIPVHEKFISEQIESPIYIRLMPEENTVCFFSKNITSVAWHCVQFFIPKFFKIFKEKKISADEVEFLKTLTNKKSTAYIDKISEITNSESFKVFALNDQLKAFEKKLFEKKVEAAEENLRNIESSMERALEEYRHYCEKRTNAAAIVYGLTVMRDGVDEHTELQDYLLHNPRISNVKLNGSTISFVVKTYLAPHHVDEWETISKRNEIFKSYVTRDIPDPNDIKLLLDAILSSNRKLKLKMCAYFSLDYFGSNVTSKIRYDYVKNDPTLKSYIPNPHLNHHNCFGQNKTVILEQLIQGDAIGAIECCNACAQRVNIHEGITFSPFVLEILSCKEKCFVSDDGKEMNPKEAIAYLKEISNE